MEAQEISKLFESYGDFFLYKDTLCSIYMEFFFIDPQLVPSQRIDHLINHMVQRADLKVIQAENHKQAPKFKAHTNYDVKK